MSSFSDTLAKYHHQQQHNTTEQIGTLWTYTQKPTLDAISALKADYPKALMLVKEVTNTSGYSTFIFGAYENQTVATPYILDDNALHEYHDPATSSYFYIDVDKYVSTQMTDNIKSEILFTVLKHVNKKAYEILKTSFNLADCSVWDACRNNKVSFHITIPFRFENKNFLNMFGRAVADNFPLIDANLYKTSARLRLPYQSKYNETTKQYEVPFKPYVSQFYNFKKILFNACDGYDKHLKVDTLKNIIKKIKTPLGSKEIEINNNLVASPDYQETNEVAFLLSCIPNYGEGQSINIWRITGEVLHYLKMDIKLWSEWSNQCTLYPDQYRICCKYWNRWDAKIYHKPLTIGWLYKLARLYVDKKDTWFKRQVLPQITTLNGSIEKYNEPHVKPYPFDKYDIIAERSPMGTGKTYQIKQYLKQNPQIKRVLFLSPVITFSYNIANEFKEFGFVNYKDKQDELTKFDKLIISLESIHRIEKTTKFDLVIVDESESILNKFTSSTIKFNNIPAIFHNIMCNASKVIFMDAFLSDRTANFIKDVYPSKRVLIRKNEAKPIRRVAYRIKSGTALIKKMISKVTQGEKIVVVTGSKNFANRVAEELTEKFPSKKIKKYTADTSDIIKKVEALNPRHHWLDTDILIWSPTFTVGVNFDIPDIFDTLFIFGASSSSSVRDIFQSSMRVRHIKTNTLFYSYSLGFDFDGSTTVENVTKQVEARSHSNKAPKWLMNLLVSSQLETNISKRCYPELFDHYLDINNYEKKTLGDKIKRGETIGRYTSPLSCVEKVTIQEFKSIEEDIKKSEATEEDKLCYRRYIMEKMLPNDVSDDIKNLVWDKIYNVTTNLVKWLRLRKQLNSGADIESVDCKILEMISDGSILIPHINKLIELLGLSSPVDLNGVVSDDTLIKNKDEIIKIYDVCKLEMDFREFNETHKKKEGSKQQPENIQLKNKINSILSRWCFSELVEESSIYKRIEGGRKMVKTWKLRNETFNMFDNVEDVVKYVPSKIEITKANNYFAGRVQMLASDA